MLFSAFRSRCSIEARMRISSYLYVDTKIIQHFNFERKPSSWDNLVLIGQNDNLFYIHLSRPEFLKKLSKKDSIL